MFHSFSKNLSGTIGFLLLVSGALLCLNFFSCKTNGKIQNPGNITGMKTPSPTLVSFAPDSGKIGDTILINGTNFNSGSDTVLFNGVLAKVVSATPTLIKVLVPSGATSGSIKITVNGISVSSTSSFQIKVLNLNIYVSGIILGNPQSACYWKNGNIIGLNGNQANGIFVSGNDVYVAGSSNILTGEQGEYWKNGVQTILNDNSSYSYVTGVFVLGSDVYASGYESDGNSLLKAKYWKNGVPVSLTDGTQNAEATSIAVVGSDVYVAGYYYNGSQHVAVYWKNGVATNLTDGTKDAEALSITVSNSVVYVAGYQEIYANDPNHQNVAMYWSNGHPVPITPGDGSTSAAATSIAVSGNNVYIAGSESPAGNSNPGKVTIAEYWTNQNNSANILDKFVLTNGSSNAAGTSIAVINSDIYVAGWEYSGTNSVPKYWKNGNPVILSGAGSASPTGIFLANQ